MKYSYNKPMLSVAELDLENCILDGSLTSKPIKVQSVTVQDYSNGFSATEFPDGFQDISFD